MNTNEKFVIAINRELGSGGRTVGRILSGKLGVPFYDKALIQALQKEYNLSVAEIEKLKGRKHGWWADVMRILNIGLDMRSYYYMPKMSDEPDLITTDEMFETETMILENLANHISVFIQASLESRVERVMRKQHKTKEEALKVIKKVDEMRENYIKKYTGTSRYDTRNYHLVITADNKTEDEIADIIMKYIESKQSFM